MAIKGRVGRRRDPHDNAALRIRVSLGDGSSHRLIGEPSRAAALCTLVCPQQNEIPPTHSAGQAATPLASDDFPYALKSLSSFGERTDERTGVINKSYLL